MKRTIEYVVAGSNDMANHGRVLLPRKMTSLASGRPGPLAEKCTPTNDLDALGEEGLVRHVLTFLNVKEHHVCKSVSKQWKSLVETLDMFRLDLSVRSPLHSKNLERALLSTIHSYADIREINFTGQRSLCDRDLLVLTSCFWSTLESIVVDDCLDITDFGLLAILNAQSQRLTRVSFRHCKHITGRFAQSAIAGQHPSLKTLDFYNTRVGRNLVQGLERCFPSLQHIFAAHTPAHFDLFEQAPFHDIKMEWMRAVGNQFHDAPFRLVLADFNATASSVFKSSSLSVFERTLLTHPSSLLDVPLDADGYTSALLYACDNDLDNLVKRLIKLGAAVDVTDRDCATPLCLAAATGSLSSVDALLANGACVNARTLSLATPLYFASEMDWTEVVAHLLAHNATPDAKTTSNSTALCVAAKNGSRASVHQLIRHRARRPSFVTLTKKATMEELMLALCLACERSHLDIVRDLLAFGLNPNLVMDNGVTPLYLACQMGHKSIVQALCMHGANPNFRRPAGGVSCLYIAAQEGKADVVRVLLSFGVHVNATMDDQSAALHIAVRMGHLEIVQVLHQAADGGDLNMQTRSGLSPLFIACEEGHTAIVTYLVESPSYKVNVNLQTHNGTSPMFIASQKGYDEIVKVLCAAGANVNLAKHNGTCPIDAAAMGGHAGVAVTLLHHGARVGGLALHFAERRDDPTMQALLMAQYQAQWRTVPPMLCPPPATLQLPAVDLFPLER
ncbi:hypothetical protein H310_05445 [Aphanomyces invadans]|uniref:F-box domain-containing protein n=1 Tax=Aphanomyces invadans TaxID=157072 RepID=A0A024U9X9_9STRA|nr:hypothetical protein H310_05445 [Aphanomyces invadans]ETW03010.1 hypothetical protein H310_05445 [Aphanomyces invadans]RHY32137.1 hypothetical protein DYB32_002831 [Aphanomyces invadans]|eukprot:XP_008868394.1 hypothetical protein H310_05445 [Aphanomyces invadans]